MVPSCALLNEFQVINIKTIKSVVAMVPHRPTLPSGVVGDRFFMVEKPRLDVSNLGIPYNSGADDDDEVVD